MSRNKYGSTKRSVMLDPATGKRKKCVGEHTLCKGICKKHGKPCLTSVDPVVLARTRKAAGKLGMKVSNVKNGVMQHRHTCEDCLSEVRDMTLTDILKEKR
jgi:hypothetical protein